MASVDRVLASLIETLGVPSLQGFYQAIGLKAEEETLVRTEPWAFVTGLIADQSVRSTTAWRLPYSMALRLGSWDEDSLRGVHTSRLIRALKTKPALHRFPDRIGSWVGQVFQRHEARESLRATFQGGSDAPSVQKTLESFAGVGPKKGQLGVVLLHDELSIHIQDMDDIGPPIDSLVRRVLVRCLGTDDDLDRRYRSIAEEACPAVPARTSTYLWEIGRQFCTTREPRCIECPLAQVCATAQGRGSNFR